MSHKYNKVTDCEHNKCVLRLIPKCQKDIDRRMIRTAIFSSKKIETKHVLGVTLFFSFSFVLFLNLDTKQVKLKIKNVKFEFSFLYIKLLLDFFVRYSLVAVLEKKKQKNTKKFTQFTKNIKVYVGIISFKVGNCVVCIH